LTTKDSTSSLPAHGETFATTHWTVVLAAGREGAPGADRALEQLCRTYWYPLYAFVRRNGRTHEDAEDLTQGFFARFLSRNYLAGVSSERGRFRAFLLASLKHYLANEWDRARRQKRGGPIPALSLDWEAADSRYQIQPADDLSPDKIYDREWALALLERVICGLADECAAADNSTLFEQLKPFLTLDHAQVPYAQVAANLHLTEGAVRVALHRLRRRYRALLRNEIAQTLSDPAQADEEIRALLGAFS
jgi:RNA polymerase sigma-70 factor (ECF subfamily)